MPQPAQAKHCDNIARTRTGISQGVERRQPGAHQRRGGPGSQFIRKPCDRTHRRDHVFAVTTIKADAGHLVRFTSEQIPAPARVTSPAVAAVPSDTDPLAASPSDHSRADGVNRAGNLMTRDARVLNAGPKALFDQRITMADAARRDFDSNCSRRRFRYRSFDNLKLSLRRRYLCNTHCSHISSTLFDSPLTPRSRLLPAR